MLKLTTFYILYIYREVYRRGFFMASNEYNHFEGVVITGNDPRMRFRNSQDPIYVAYQFVDSQPLSKLAQSFVKDQINGIIKFVSKIGK